MNHQGHEVTLRKLNPGFSLILSDLGDLKLCSPLIFPIDNVDWTDMDFEPKVEDHKVLIRWR
jgi:hypothetical protein